MVVEDVFFIMGCGIVVIGWIECGKIKVGEIVELVGIKDICNSIVIGVEMFQKILDEGMVGDNVGLLLCGMQKDDI